jgi:hypothetical protein
MRNVHLITKEQEGADVLHQYLYITSNDEIKMDDWYLDDTNSVRQAITECESYWTHRKKYQKIILTDNPDLIEDGVQAIDDEFLEWFVKNPSCEFVEISYGVLKPFKSTEKGYMIHLPDNEVLGEPKQETLEEFIKSQPYYGYCTTEYKEGIEVGAKWQTERSQMIVPPDATNIEVFAIKPDENGKLFAYIGYKISNGNFEFSTVPFTEPKPERMYSEEDLLSAFEAGMMFIGEDKGSFREWFEQQKKK